MIVDDKRLASIVDTLSCVHNHNSMRVIEDILMHIEGTIDLDMLEKYADSGLESLGEPTIDYE